MSARLASLIVAMLLLLGGGAALLSRDEAPRSEAEEVSAQLQRAPAVVAALPDVVAPAAAPAPDASVVEATPPDALPVPTPTAPVTATLADLVTDAGEAPLPEPTALDAGTRVKPRDARFGVRWGEPGLCGDEPRAALAQRRAAMLSRFTTVQRTHALLHVEPTVPIAFVDDLGTSLLTARDVLIRLLGPRADVPFPELFVYESAEQLRSVACVNTATAGYYDGAIHLPANDPDAHRTVVHELTHHVLNTLGVHKPMWFHEGLAMYAADERWWEDARGGLVPWLRREHLPFGAMVEAFPHTADELFAGAAYYQSYQMVRFVGARAGRSDFGWLVDELAQGKLAPQTAFEDGLALSGPALERQWQAFVLSE